MRMKQADKILSTYSDDNLMFRAFTFITENGHYGARFYDKGVWQTDEIYEGHNEEYAESAAENYVLGIKKIQPRV
tara:strand:+ start:4274 stop:4498 length:225 start_codon:yes stop_codon:yes gene_type:complete